MDTRTAIGLLQAPRDDGLFSVFSAAAHQMYNLEKPSPNKKMTLFIHCAWIGCLQTGLHSEVLKRQGDNS